MLIVSITVLCYDVIMKITADDFKSLGAQRRSDVMVLQGIKLDVFKFVVDELNSKEDSWLLEPGEKRIEISFVVLDH